jgi:CheY-like chemotaxis protein
MALTSLLVCADAQAVQVLSQILRDLDMQVEMHPDVHSALTPIADRRFDAVLVDCQDEAKAIHFITGVRGSSRNAHAVLVALVNNSNNPREIFAKGANILIYKPISRERALHSLHAARGLVRQERRLQPRMPLHAPASIAYAGTEDVPASIVEVSESGLGMRTSKRLPPACKVYFQFSLPGNESTIRLSGEVMWQDVTGRVGIRFAKVPDGSKRILQNWLKHQSSAPQASHPLELETEPEIPKVRLSAGLGLLSASAPDRRNLSRRACCLGAEVYRDDSKVPNRCTLSDISTGGCYIETTEPFPEGTILTVVVRTHELKLCIAGKVQSTHPGFGMGLRFTSRSDAEQAQVKQLIAYAESESKLLG